MKKKGDQPQGLSLGASKGTNSEADFKFFFENSGIAITVINLDGTYRFVNTLSAQKLGYTPEQVIGRSMFEFLPAETARKYLERNRQIILSGTDEVYEDTFKLPVGLRTFLITDNVLKDKDGDGYALVSSSIDITERKRAEEELRTNYSLLRIAGKTAKFGGWSLWLSENKVVWSDEVAVIHEMPIGYSPSIEEGINFYAPEWQDSIKIALNKCIAEGIAFDEELELITAKGKRIWVRTLGEPAFDDKGNIYKVQGAFQDITDRKLLERALHISEINARAIMESTEDAIVLVRKDGTVVDTNEGHARRLGTTRKELLGKNVYKYLPPEVAGTRKHIVEQVIATGNPYSGEDCRDGIWNEMSVFPIFVDQKITDQVAVFAHNITFRKQIEEALRKSEELLSLFMKYTPVYTFIKEVSPTQSKVLKASENFIDMVGIAGSDMTGKDMFELFSPEFASKITEEDWRVISEGKILIIDEEYNNKSYVTIKFPIPLKETNLLAGFTIENTERKLVENELKRMNSLLTATLESTADGILVVNNERKITSFNRKFAELWQIPEEFLQTTCDDAKVISTILGQLKDPVAFLQRVDEIYAGVDEFSFDVIEFNDGRIFERYSQNQQLDHNNIGRVWSFRDITRRKQAEQAIHENEIRLQELNATKDKLFSIIAHDLINPFNSIVGFSNLLRSQIAEENLHDIEKYVDIIHNSSEQALDLLQNLLDWSRSQVGRLAFKPECIDVVVQINHTCDLLFSLAQQKSVTIRLFSPPELWIIADKPMINTILRNLLSNAIKFSYTGGEVEILVSQDNDQLTVSIKDYGVGIPEQKLDNLFRIDKNLSTPGTMNEKGTGLGLILCKELIDKHNGQIWVKSELQKGSTFSFSIPYRKA